MTNTNTLLRRWSFLWLGILFLAAGFQPTQSLSTRMKKDGDNVTLFFTNNHSTEDGGFPWQLHLETVETSVTGEPGEVTYREDKGAEGERPPGQETPAGATLSTAVYLYVNGVVIPFLGLLGLIGNLLNLAILTCRYVRRGNDTLEKVALIGLIALTLSDLCFCLTIIPSAFVPQPSAVYESLTFAALYQMYGQYVQNVFIKTSTWLTTLVATARYIAICHPLKARFCFGLQQMRVAILATYACWILGLLPLLWALEGTWHSIDVNATIYVIDHGPFIRNSTLHTSVTYLWAFLGFFIPVSILAFCNICLIRALRESHSLRRSVAHTVTPMSRAGVRGSDAAAYRSNQKTSNRITLTLVILVLMFLILVSPSELLHFYTELRPETFDTFEVLMVFANVLQAINFSLHFVMYCIVNVTFRRTLLLLARYCLRGLRRCGRRRHTDIRHREEGTSGRFFSARSFDASRRSTLIPSNMKSHETNI